MATEAYRGELKRIFTGYRRLTPEVERRLAALGIVVERRRKHVVLLVPGKTGVRPVPISNSGSDARGGLNIVTVIMRTRCL